MQNQKYIIRTHQLGDMGWITYRHALTVAKEFDWGEAFEAVVGDITAQFIKTYDPKNERCFIAEKNGEMIGCVFLVNAGEGAAKLRLLFVEPQARGMGLATRLVEEAVDFARDAGYEKILLWTMKILDSARYIYKKVGFKVIDEEINQEFGEKLVSETWLLSIDDNEETSPPVKS